MNYNILQIIANKTNIEKIYVLNMTYHKGGFNYRDDDDIYDYPKNVKIGYKNLESLKKKLNELSNEYSCDELIQRHYEEYNECHSIEDFLLYLIQNYIEITIGYHNYGEVNNVILRYEEIIIEKN